jgi:hypothetical protein
MEISGLAALALGFIFVGSIGNYSANPYGKV